MRVRLYGRLRTRSAGRSSWIQRIARSVGELRRQPSDRPSAAAEALGRSRAFVGSAMISDDRLFRRRTTMSSFSRRCRADERRRSPRAARGSTRRWSSARSTEQARGDGAIVSFVGLARPRIEGRNAVERCSSNIIRRSPGNRSKRSPSPAHSGSMSAMSGWSIAAAKIRPGEPIVFAGAASLHRRAAFDAPII